MQPANQPLDGFAPIQLRPVHHAAHIRIVDGEEVEAEVSVRHVERRLQCRERSGGSFAGINKVRGGPLLPDMDYHREKRIARQRARRPDRGDHSVERQVLIRIRAQCGFSRTGEHFAQRRVAGKIIAQDQDVDEEADELIERGIGTSGNRSSERNVRPASRPVQHHRHRGLQEHERCGAHIASQPSQLGAGGRVDRERNRFRHTTQHFGAGPVGRQAGLLRQSG